MFSDRNKDLLVKDANGWISMHLNSKTKQSRKEQRTEKKRF
jgi:hypothetical protein